MPAGLNGAAAAPGLDAAWQGLRQSPVRPALWLALARPYAATGLAWQAAYAARQASRLDRTLAGQLDAPGIRAWRDLNAGDAALGCAMVQKAAARVRALAAQEAHCPGDWLS